MDQDNEEQLPGNHLVLNMPDDDEGDEGGVQLDENLETRRE